MVYIDAEIHHNGVPAVIFGPTLGSIARFEGELIPEQSRGAVVLIQCELTEQQRDVTAPQTWTLGLVVFATSERATKRRPIRVR